MNEGDRISNYEGASFTTSMTAYEAEIREQVAKTVPGITFRKFKQTEDGFSPPSGYVFGETTSANKEALVENAKKVREMFEEKTNISEK